MSEEEFKMPRKFTFDEFYEMLKEFVNDPKARAALATYDAEGIAGRGRDLGSEESDLSWDSWGIFSSIGYSIMHKSGWPSYSEIIENTKNDYELRSKLCRGLGFIVCVGRRLIRKEVWEKGWDFQDEDFDINDRASVLRLLQLWTKKYPGDLTDVLTGELTDGE
jgi:hypothetical protein